MASARADYIDVYLADNTLVLSPSDLNNFVQCRHLTALDEALLRGEIEGPSGERDPLADLLSSKGDLHEAAYLEQLRDEGREIVEIANPEKGLKALRLAAAQTEQAMRAGADVIYQATFLQEGLAANGLPTLYRGHADVLYRVDEPSDLGAFSYEVADAKLARRAKPYFILQLCFYSEMVEAIQAVSPEHIHVVLGTGETETYRLAEFAAYFRQVRRRFLSGLGSALDTTYPEPVSHCQVCKWASDCDERRVADDHLSLVAGLPSTQRKRLKDAGVATLAELGRLDPETHVDGIRTEQLAKRRHQAALQLQTREGGEPALDLLEPEPNRGFARMPGPSEGDVFFDLEGDPFFDGGLEYLWGFVTDDQAEPQFTVWWGRDRAEEREAFERFIDFITERRTLWPDLHVYHYATYEITALKRLAGAFGSRESELDQLLRDGVFVDLYRVVAESMRIGMPSYSLKKVEAFYMQQRETEVTDGNDSVIEFERWLDEGGLEGGDQAILDAIADYNRDDCLSTLWLRNWLLERRVEAEARFEEAIVWFVPEEKARSDKTVEVDAETAALVTELGGDLNDEELDGVSAEARTTWLLAQLLTYHQREARPAWWAFFDRRGSEPDSLIDDADCIGALSTTGQPPEPVGRGSTVHSFTFPAQETKIREGSTVHDVAFGDKAGQIVSIDVDLGEVALKRGPSLAGLALPAALMPGGPYGTDEQRAALRRFAGDVIDRGLEADGPYRACRDLLLGRAPNIVGAQAGEPLYANAIDVAELRDLVARMDGTCLVIQGPPGSGKTYTGARLITSLIDAGHRVGVTSTSHKVIHNMLDEIEQAAAEEGVEFVGLKKASAGRPDSEYDSEHIGCTKDNSALTNPDVKLTAGTAWHYARDEVDGTLDYLFIDEAGQVSLADALALGTAARNIVLLGDPQQLPQVTQGAHPDGSDVSALEHVLGEDQTIPPDRGVFLDNTWRLHPHIASFCSELMYDGRLGSAPGRERQRIVVGGSPLDGAGLRWCPVAHEGDSQSSISEAEAISRLVDELRGASVVNCEGVERLLDLVEDVLVVTPYNAQVKCLESRLPSGMRIGTVDKFQGQEAEVVFFSLATSSGAEIPRGLEFLLSRNRLNVAVSRARCVAVVVASPGLLNVDCQTVGQMKLVNAICRVGEIGETSEHV
jgi:predicted RecB family nuclease